MNIRPVTNKEGFVKHKKPKNKRNSQDSAPGGFPRKGPPGSRSEESPYRPGKSFSKSPSKSHGKSHAKNDGKAKFQDFKSQRNRHPQESSPLRTEKISQELIDKSAARIKLWLSEGETLRSSRPLLQPTIDPLKAPLLSISLDPWQQDVLDRLIAGENVVVDAPTTAGKTRAVEAFFHLKVKDPQFRAVYTTPVKSLTNDKLLEFREMFGVNSVGISTGDVKESLDAPIVVATLESYRNSLVGTEPDLGRNIVIFDEYHYLQDESRGSSWEEAIILTPPSCQILMLSASVSNAEKFAEWIDRQGKRRTQLVRTLVRPVPLTPIVNVSGHWLCAEDIPQEFLKTPDRRLMEQALPYENLVKNLPALLDLKLTPSIIYTGKRADSENLAQLIVENLAPLPFEEAEAIGRKLQEVHQLNQCLTFFKPQMRRMIQTYGVAFHHSGLAPQARIAIERLLKEGLIRFCVATMGLSIGINFSVRSSLIADYERPGESGPTTYAEGEILQMLGRAGRRGKDVIGFSLWPTMEAYLKFGQSKREECHSKLRSDPTTLLGLVGRGMSLGAIENLYQKSFLKFENANIELRLIRKEEVLNKLASQELPCTSPVKEFGVFQTEVKDSKDQTIPKKAKCHTCPFVKNCHQYLAFRMKSRLAAMHVHLHQLSCLTDDEQLTPVGKVARFFPQTGGLLIAKLIVDGHFSANDLVKACELFACFSIPRHKDLFAASNYKFPFQANDLEKQLEIAYPVHLFPELYDAPFRQRTWHQLKDFNPQAGWFVRTWLKESIGWQDLAKQMTSPSFGQGDLMGAMFRIATYLQSLSSLEDQDFARTSRELRRHLLRAPLDFLGGNQSTAG